MNFEDAIKSEPSAENEFLWHPKSVWNQGLGVYGGLTFATILRSVSNVTERPVRRVSVTDERILFGGLSN